MSRYGIEGAVALDDEHIRAADRLVEPAVQLAVGELGDVGVAQRDAQLRGDLGAQLGVRSSRDEVQPLLRDELHHKPVPLVMLVW